MKTYAIRRTHAGVACQANDNAAGPKHNGNVTMDLAGKFSVGDSSAGTKALAAAVMAHYYNASASDPGATAEAKRRERPFLDAYLIHHKMPVGGRLVINSDVISNWISRS
jgi:hypothetical protein